MMIKRMSFCLPYETPACEILAFEAPRKPLCGSNEPIGGGDDPDQDW